jgi:hypothetical protein
MIDDGRLLDRVCEGSWGMTCCDGIYHIKSVHLDMQIMNTKDSAEVLVERLYWDCFGMELGYGASRWSSVADDRIVNCIVAVL